MDAMELFQTGAGESAANAAGKAGKGKSEGMGTLFGALMAVLGQDGMAVLAEEGGGSVAALGQGQTQGQGKGKGAGPAEPRAVLAFQQTLSAVRDRAAGEQTKQALTELSALVEKTAIVRRVANAAADGAATERAAGADRSKPVGLLDGRGPLSADLVQLLQTLASGLPETPKSAEAANLVEAVDAALAAVQTLTAAGAVPTAPSEPTDPDANPIADATKGFSPGEGALGGPAGGRAPTREQARTALDTAAEGASEVGEEKDSLAPHRRESGATGAGDAIVGTGEPQSGGVSDWQAGDLPTEATTEGEPVPSQLGPGGEEAAASIAAQAHPDPDEGGLLESRPVATGEYDGDAGIVVTASEGEGASREQSLVETEMGTERVEKAERQEAAVRAVPAPADGTPSRGLGAEEGAPGLAQTDPEAGVANGDVDAGTVADADAVALDVGASETLLAAGDGATDPAATGTGPSGPPAGGKPAPGSAADPGAAKTGSNGATKGEPAPGQEVGLGLLGEDAPAPPVAGTEPMAVAVKGSADTLGLSVREGATAVSALVRPETAGTKGAPTAPGSDGNGTGAAGGGLGGKDGLDFADGRQGRSGQNGEGPTGQSLPGNPWGRSTTGAAAGAGPAGAGPEPFYLAERLAQDAAIAQRAAPALRGVLDRGAGGAGSGQAAGAGAAAGAGEDTLAALGRALGSAGGGQDGQPQGGLGAQPLVLNGQGQPQAAAFTAFRGGRPPARSVPDQVSVQLRRGVQQGQDRLTIQLEPSELGRIDIRLEIGRDRQVRAHIAVDRSQTLELLQRDARGLERLLQDAGFKTEGDSLSFSLKQQDHPADGGRRHGAGAGAGGRGSGAEAGEGDDTTLEGPHPTMILTSDRVDLRI